jgi:predicted metal-dependent enzyme (double-stranded beta helix superfamily)
MTLPTAFKKKLERSLNLLDKKIETSNKDIFKTFPQHAAKLLSTLDHQSFNNPKLIASLLNRKKWPRQQFPSGHFADLSFTLYRNHNFLLDMYVWHHQDTNIHDHHFSGAFKIITGNSFHIGYKFEATEKYFPWLEKGKLSVTEKSSLIEGDVKAIAFSDKFIHQNLHSTNPCITLCLRTIDHPKKLLSSYYNRGMKIKLYRIKESETKLMEGISHLLQKPENEQLCIKLIDKLSDHCLVSISMGQHRFLNNSPSPIQNLAREMLLKRNKKIFSWVYDVLKVQESLNMEMRSMFKDRP